MRPLLLPLLLAASLLASCTTVVNPVTGKEERTVLSEEAEAAEGKKAHQGVLAEYGVYQDAQLQAYVKALGERLAAQSHRAKLDWTFTVLDSPEVNAFALPGGYVYVTRGIMAYMESEADLAGVIGHEIGHVTARHGAQRATRAQTAGIGVLAASVLGAVLGVGDLASQVSQGVAAGYVAKYSREQELQADRLGAEYLVRSDYDPQNMVDVIEVLRRQEQFAADQARAQGRAPKQGGDWLASHPSNAERLEDIRAIAAKYDRKHQGAYVEDARARYLKAIDGMPFGESRAQGMTRGRNFYHEPLGIALTAPQGWKILNSAEAITLANGAGDAGLIVQLAPPKAGDTHEEILKAAFKPTSGRTEKRTLNGFAATHFVGQAQTQQGRSRSVAATVVTGPEGKHYVMLYGAKDAQALQKNLAEIRQAENSFRALSAADRKAAEPWTLRSVPFPRGGFDELARRAPPQLANAEQQLRLLNGVYGGQNEPKAGQPVKVIEAR